MRVLVYLPLLLPLLAPLGARQLSERCEPRLATWLLTASSLVLAAASTVSPGLLTITGHTTTAAATAAALFLLDRRLSAIAAVCALLEGFTGVYVGDHYPHDVLGAIVIATPVALIASLILRGLIHPLVSRLRMGGGALQPLLAVGSAVEATR